MKKKFGQNFLKNKTIINHIINFADINKESNVLEIGPGNGALSIEIIKKKPKKYIAVEIDITLKKKLEQIFFNSHYQLVFTDALKFKELNYFNKNVILISNLPFNISILLLIKWINLIAKYTWCSRMILMFQKEVAERIVANENSKKYGRISIFSSAFFEVTKILEVPKINFLPIPKVDSTILLFKPLLKSKVNFEDLKSLELLTKEFFNNRRKKIKNKIIKLFNEEKIKKNELENLFDLRAENIKKETFYYLAKILNKPNLKNNI